MTTDSTYLKYCLSEYKAIGTESFLWCSARKIKDPTLRLLVNNLQATSISIQEYVNQTYPEEVNKE